MKTNFKTFEDQKDLSAIIYSAIIKSEFILFSPSNIKRLPQYALLTLKLRKKCFEFLEEKDPNEEFFNTAFEIREINGIKGLYFKETENN